MITKTSSFIFFIFLTFNLLYSQINIFNDYPDWQSSSLNHVATGLGAADINQDGWKDIIVANGNDIYRQALVVYYNNGDGTFPTNPSWSSSDIDYHGHLSVGDINGDNLPDVAVSVFLGPAGFSEPGYVKVYFNQGNSLEESPSYQSADSMYTFSCALGDADGDGDLDLAVACGEPYSGHSAKGKIYYNLNDTLQSRPGWESQVLMGAMDVDFADFDNNGFFDIAFACHLSPNYIFYSDSTGNISTSPDWSSLDNNYYANSLTIARLDSNSFPDLIISDNNQLGGHGKYKAYIFDSKPQGQSNPGWLSNNGGYGSAVLAEDLDFDNQPELLAGRWWGRVELFKGEANAFTTNPVWYSLSNSVIEAFVLSDIDQDGITLKTDTISIQYDSSHVFYLSEMSVEKINSLYVNGQILEPGIDYCTNSSLQWISTKQDLFINDVIIIEYEYSKDRDLLVSNWDSGIGNYLFYNQSVVTKISHTDKKPVSIKTNVSPNPFNQTCKIEIITPQKSNLSIRIYDITGRLVKNIFSGKTTTEKQSYYWNGNNDIGAAVSSGTYFYRIDSGTHSYIGKILLLR